MEPYVCPVWVGYFLASPVRKLVQHPDRILSPYIAPGMTVMDVGCAMGYFSIPAARMVGDEGKVVCVDMQQGMLSRLMKRAKKAGLSGRIEPRLCEAHTLGVDDLSRKVDLAFAIAMVHETPDPERLIQELSACLKVGGRLLVAEPKGHVTEAMFADTRRFAEASGLTLVESPKVRCSHAAVYAMQGA